MCKYKVRSFYSKGAFLVLVWVFLEGIACFFVRKILNSWYKETYEKHYNVPNWLAAIITIVGFIGSTFFGWLADAKLGNYRMMKYSIILLFIVSVCLSACTILPLYGILNLIVGCILEVAFLLIIFGILVTSLQLGLDQMPDASSTSITSFICLDYFLLLCYQLYFTCCMGFREFLY